MSFEIPEDVAGLSDEALADHLTSAYAEGSELSEVSEHSDEQIERMEALASFITFAKGEQHTRAERERRLSAARESLAATFEDSDEDSQAEGEPQAEETSEEESFSNEEGEGSEDEDSDDDAHADGGSETSEETVVASGSSAVERVARNSERPDVPERPAVAITAGAEVPDKAIGQSLNGITELGEAMMAKLSAMAPIKSTNGGPKPTYNVARLTLPRTDGLVASSDNDMETFTKARRESRLPGGSLAASRIQKMEQRGGGALTAAGWCAPSETFYDLCSYITADGLYDLAEVQVSRGGMRYTQGPDISGINIADIGFRQTEAEAEAGTEKPCEEIVCPGFEDERLDATGICIKAGLLQVSAYPELVQEWMETYLTLYQHRYSMDTLTKVHDLIGTPQTLTGVWDSALSLLHAIELVAEGYRQDHLMAFNQTLEVVLPHWVLPALRADLANRNGVDSTNVSDAELMAHFATRNVAPQFIRHYQDLDTSSGIATTYPSEVEFTMYPAGSYVRGVTDVINLGTMYDAPTLATNTYTALFAETGMLVAEMCTGGKRVNLPLGVTGKTAVASIDQHFTSGS